MKKLLSIVLSLCILLSISAGLDFSAYAAKSGDYEYTVLSDGTAEITVYNGNKTNLIIPSKLDGYTVTSIGDSSFADCESLTNVTIPNSILNIRNFAFSNCKSLTNITIPNSVIGIFECVFLRCTSLSKITVDSENKYYSSLDGVLFDKNKTKLIQYPIGNARTNYTIPTGVETVCNDAFAFCENLTDITISNSVINIDEGAFNYCTNLTNITIPNSVTNIGEFAFYACPSLVNVEIGNGVTMLGDCVFARCNSLTNIIISSNVMNIGDYAFALCESLTSIAVDSENEHYSSIDGVLFNKDKTELIQYPIGNKRTDYTIPNGVRVIDESAFSRCENLINISISNSVTSIGVQAFSWSESLATLDIPDSVTYIGENAFEYCEGLTDVTIGNGITMLDYYVFYGCKSLKTITISESLTSIGEGVFGHCESLTDVYYSGSKSQWNSVRVDNVEYYNMYLIHATVHCNNGKLQNHCWDGDGEVVTKEASCTTDGIRIYTCVVCNATKEEKIKALGHKVVVDKAVAATYTKEGKTGGKHCKRCGKVIVVQKKVAKKKLQTPSVSSIKASKKAFTIKWKKVSDATGYEIQYSTSKKFTKSTTKKVTIKSSKTTSATVKKLKSKKKYYVQIRAYKSINGKKVYSSWSKAKTVTTKK